MTYTCLENCMDLLQELELRLHRILYARILQEQVLCCHYGGSKRLSYASYVSSVPEDTSNITYIKFYRAKLF